MDERDKIFRKVFTKDRLPEWGNPVGCDTSRGWIVFKYGDFYEPGRYDAPITRDVQWWLEEVPTEETEVLKSKIRKAITDNVTVEWPSHWVSGTDKATDAVMNILKPKRLEKKTHE